MTRQEPRRKASQGDYLLVLHEVLRELETATKRFDPMASLHEGYAVILEELDEAWDEIKINPKGRDDDRVRAELIQVAAMTIRTITDCLGVKRNPAQDPDAAQRIHLAMHGHTMVMH